MSKFYPLIILLIAIIFNRNTKAQTYYIDSIEGKDEWSGEFPDSNNSLTDGPWKTFHNINTGDFYPGDIIRFRCNRTWRESVTISASGRENAPITFCSYGSGDKPLFLGSKALNNPEDWSNIGLNIWATGRNTFPKANYRGIGFLLVGEEAQKNVGELKQTIDLLDTERDFFWDETNQRIILYCPAGNPAEIYHSIEAACMGASIYIKNQSYLIIKDLAFKYQNTAAIWPDSFRHIILDNLDISFLGGGRCLWTDGYVRDGDAIPPHGNSNNVYIQNCTISQVFDVGIAPQLASNEKQEMYNIFIENNVIDRCGLGMGIAAHKCDASEIYAVYFRNNVITNSGYGWSGISNSVHGRGISILEAHCTDNKPNVHDIKIEYNKIDTYAWWGINVWEGNFVIRNNVITNGLGDYSKGMAEPAGIALTGGDYSEKPSPGEATGIVKNNFIRNNKGHGILILNNTPLEPEILEITQNILYNNGNENYSNFKTTTSFNTKFRKNIIYSTISLCFEIVNFNRVPVISNENTFYTSPGSAWSWKKRIFDLSDFSSYQSMSGQDTLSYAGNLNEGVSFDSDFDGLNDFSEFELGTSPTIADTDNDGMPDGWEVQYELNPTENDSDSDNDKDGLTSLNEFEQATNPIDPDTDNDGISDGWEVQYGLNPSENDSDLDPDGDTYTNAQEYTEQTDPLDSESHPKSTQDIDKISPQMPHPTDKTEKFHIDKKSSTDSEAGCFVKSVISVIKIN